MQAGPRWRATLSSEALIFATSVFFALACNGAFWSAALAGHAASAPSTWLHAAALCGLLVSVHALLLALLLHRAWLRPVLALLIMVTALAVYYMNRYGVLLDPGMLRNVLRTDVKEARELIGWALLPHFVLYAAVPLLLLSRVQVARRGWRRAVLVRTGFVAGMAVLAVACLLAIFQDFSALMRNHKEVRYLVTPGNVLYSTSRVFASDARQAGRPRIPVGTDARLGPSWPAAQRPLALVLVVGETARAANWGLNGYARQTTPKLAGLLGQGLVNFTDVESCGTNTETSLPCMFSPGGRHDYDEDRIRGSESLLHVLQHAGVPVLWRDNQSGCKGVCGGLPQEQLDASQDPRWCHDGLCLDEIMVEGLRSRFEPGALAREAAAGLVAAASASPSALHGASSNGAVPPAGAASVPPGTRVVVLHQLGNHGPAYFKRYPPEFQRFTPTCETAELSQCTQEQIVNAYDNALLYTDHLLVRVIDELNSLEATHDTVMLYLSDHGESLGESNLYLHGIPRAIAPDVQTHVPMVAWMSPSFARRIGLDEACWAARARRPASHDHLFHTVLGLLDVQTSVYQLGWDLAATCRRGH